MMLFRIFGLIIILLLAGCGGSKPVIEPVPPVPDIPKLNIPPDPGMFKVLKVVRKYGKKTESHLTYAEYKRREAAGTDSTFNPDIFYDLYELDLNEKNYWITLTLRTAARSIREDVRIRRLMQDFAENTIDLILKTPSGTTFLLSDSDGDGVLDFAGPLKSKNTGKTTVNLELLRRLQQKYGWILGIIKRHYK